MAEKKKEKGKKNIARLVFLSIAGLVVLMLLVFGTYSLSHSSKTYARQYIGEVEVGGLKKGELAQLLDRQAGEFLSKPFFLIIEDKRFEFTPSEMGLGYNLEQTATNIWNFGRSNGLAQSFKEQVQSLVRDRVIEPAFDYNQPSLDQKVAEIARQIDQPEQDYSFVYTGTSFKLSEQKEGYRIDQEKIKNQLLSQIKGFKMSEVVLVREYYSPKVLGENAQARLSDANQILSAGELMLRYESQSFSADEDTIASFVSSKPDGEDLKIIFNQDRIKVFVESVAKGIDVEAANSRLVFSGGKITIFDKSQNGKKLKQAETVTDIENALLSRILDKPATDSKIVALRVEVTPPEIADEKIGELGIVEQVGVAETNFNGSPANRVHNIQTGANALNGVLLKPGEEFSTLGKLGEIDASSGYLEELVIKENRTVPEFGGGLCQVSSTLFRSALNAGMEITERRNHKYRVSYYEPPVGMDATIYDPAPDFKFKNNYNSHILIQSKVVGTKISFELYGTKDARAVSISEPIVYDFVDPGPAIEIETDTLPPGERQRIERSHQGATAKFDYKVEKDGTILQQKTFVSKYVPWPEKWLVGKATETEAAPAE